jgi:hypothetical protein
MKIKNEWKMGMFTPMENNMDTNGFIYFAAPYTHDDPDVMKRRHAAVVKATAVMVKKGYVLYSPLVHTVPLEDYVDGSHAFWMNQDLTIMFHATICFVLMLPGWDTSKGVLEEIQFAHDHNQIVLYLTYDECVQ